MALKFKTKYDLVGNLATFEPNSDKPSLTDESFAKECDIEFIISNFVNRGIMPPEHPVQYGKQISSDDYARSVEIVAECKSMFESLPATEKERFGNSVGNYLNFVSDPKNLKESYERGYIDPASVDISDVYPERYKKETFEQATQDVVDPNGVSSQSGSNSGSKPDSENPT